MKKKVSSNSGYRVFSERKQFSKPFGISALDSILTHVFANRPALHRNEERENCITKNSRDPDICEEEVRMILNCSFSHLLIHSRHSVSGDF